MRDIKFKMRCTDGTGKSHTTGKVYNVYEGGYMDNDSTIWYDNSGAHDSLESINNFYRSQFEIYEGIGIGLEPTSVTMNLDTLTLHNIINDNLIRLLEEIDEAGFKSDTLKVNLEYEDNDIIYMIDL